MNAHGIDHRMNLFQNGEFILHQLWQIPFLKQEHIPVSVIFLQHAVLTVGPLNDFLFNGIPQLAAHTVRLILQQFVIVVDDNDGRHRF